MVLEDPGQPVGGIGSRRTTRVDDAPQRRTSSAYGSSGHLWRRAEAALSGAQVVHRSKPREPVRKEREGTLGGVVLMPGAPARRRHGELAEKGPIECGVCRQPFVIGDRPRSGSTLGARTRQPLVMGQVREHGRHDHVDEAAT
jgi:hypothetical protein